MTDSTCTVDLHEDSSLTLTEFPKFDQLPDEIQRSIFRKAALSPGPFCFSRDGKHAQTSVATSRLEAVNWTAREVALEEQPTPFDLTPANAYSFLGVTPLLNAFTDSSLGVYQLTVDKYESDTHPTPDESLSLETIRTRAELHRAHQIVLDAFTLAPGDTYHSALSAIHEVLRRVELDRGTLAPDFTHIVLPPKGASRREADDSYDPLRNDQIRRAFERLLSGSGSVKLLQDPQDPQIFD